MRDDSMTGGGAAARPKVLVLTPVKNAVQHLDRYLELLQAVHYPRPQLSLGLLDSDSEDGTFERVLKLKPQLAARCRRVHISQRDFGFRMPKGVARWAPAYQLVRRSALARSRNNLLFRALDDEDWVLWIDVDVIDYPIDIIDTLLATNLDIVQPHCVLDRGGATFDLNAWIDKGAKHMQDLRDMKGAVRLDAVGGTMLLVRADLHRDGLIFPPFRYGLESPWIRAGGEVETEGFGILAKDMGLQCWGLPNVEIVHAPF
jgi:glycosyltransferase involved in cell wall biosynthesis